MSDWVIEEEVGDRGRRELDVIVDAPAEPDDEWSRQRLFTAVGSTLTGPAALRPMAVVIEDVHWRTRRPSTSSSTCSLRLERFEVVGDAEAGAIVSGNDAAVGGDPELGDPRVHRCAVREKPPGLSTVRAQVHPRHPGCGFWVECLGALF